MPPEPTCGSDNVRVSIIALLGVPLVGCSPKPLPDWAVNRQAAPVESARITTTRQAPDRGPPVPVTPTNPQTELLPFTPEWQAREDAFDQQLRRTMNICRGC